MNQIEFETALLLRDKNFENWDNNITFPKNKTEYRKSNIAVNQDIIKNWLREKHNIFIDIIPFYNEEDLPIITIPKGTVLFRNHDNPQVIANDFVGMPKKSFWNGEEYYLSSNHLVWYSLRPFEKMFGDITSINVLQNDIKVI
jgi:hypothetical protein